MFELPELTGLDLAQLQEAVDGARAAFTERYDQGATTQEDLQELQRLAGLIKDAESAHGVEQARVAAEAEPEPAAAPEPAGPTAADAALEKFLEAMKTQPEPIPAEPAPAPTAAEPPAPAAPAVVEPAPVSIAAAAAEPGPESVELPVTKTPIVILASADIPGIDTGVALEGWDGLVAAVTSKASAIPNLAGSKYPVASIQKPIHEDRFIDGKSQAEINQMYNDLASVDYLMSGLQASGGWCSPNETIWEFACIVEAPPEAVDLPLYGVRRGGLHFPISPTFRDFYALENNGLFTWTEADDIAAETGSPTKPCFKIPCVDFDDARLELEGLCVTAGNLMNEAYPELIRRYMSLVLTAHEHRMNARKIQKMLTLIDDDVTLAGTFAAASETLAGLELQVQDLRDQFSMADGALLEAMVPRWLRGPIRADVARRDYGGDLNAVTNAEIQSYLLASGVRLQFVSDWQVMGDPDNPATVWPTEVEALVWLPGAYRQLGGPKLDIAVARDSTLNATNDYTVAFTEEAFQVFKPGCGARKVTIPICPSGAVGPRADYDCS